MSGVIRHLMRSIEKCQCIEAFKVLYSTYINVGKPIMKYVDKCRPVTV